MYLCHFCCYHVAIERLFLRFYVFQNILSKNNPIYTKFCTLGLVLGLVYEIGTKNELNITITFEVIIIFREEFLIY